MITNAVDGNHDNRCSHCAEMAEGNTELAQHRIEDVICLAVATLTALTHLPVQNSESCAGKRRVAATLGSLLCEAKMDTTTADYLFMLIHPSTCANVLKVSDTQFLAHILMSSRSGAHTCQCTEG